MTKHDRLKSRFKPQKSVYHSPGRGQPVSGARVPAFREGPPPSFLLLSHRAERQASPRLPLFYKSTGLIMRTPASWPNYLMTKGPLSKHRLHCGLGCRHASIGETHTCSLYPKVSEMLVIFRSIIWVAVTQVCSLCEKCLICTPVIHALFSACYSFTKIFSYKSMSPFLWLGNIVYSWCINCFISHFLFVLL